MFVLTFYRYQQQKQQQQEQKDKARASIFIEVHPVSQVNLVYLKIYIFKINYGRFDTRVK